MAQAVGAHADNQSRAPSWVVLLLGIFGAGGAGNVWLSQRNDLERLTSQVKELDAKNTSLLADADTAKHQCAAELSGLKQELQKQKAETEETSRALVQCRESLKPSSFQVSGDSSVNANGTNIHNIQAGRSPKPCP